MAEPIEVGPVIGRLIRPSNLNASRFHACFVGAGLGFPFFRLDWLWNRPFSDEKSLLILINITMKQHGIKLLERHWLGIRLAKIISSDLFPNMRKC